MVNCIVMHFHLVICVVVFHFNWIYLGSVGTAMGWLSSKCTVWWIISAAALHSKYFLLICFNLRSSFLRLSHRFLTSIWTSRFFCKCFLKAWCHYDEDRPVHVMMVDYQNTVWSPGPAPCQTITWSQQKLGTASFIQTQPQPVLYRVNWP